MRSKVVKIAGVVGVLGLLALPAVVLTQGPGTQGRVLNRRTRAVFPNLTAALAAGTLPGDVLLAAGNIVEPAPVSLAGFSGTIVGETRLGFAPTISVAPAGVGPCTSGLDCVIDATGRAGLVQLIGLNVRAPVPVSGLWSIGIESDADGNPLTVRNCRITGATAATVFEGIDLIDEFGGPFNIQSNTITGRLSLGIYADGDGVNPITATIKSNRINHTGSTGFGTIGLYAIDIPAGSITVIERNTVDGGGAAADGIAGIAVDNSFDVIVRRNTVRNFSDPVTPSPFPIGRGIACDNCDGLQVLANAARDNMLGIAIDNLGGDSGTPGPAPLVNNNNITSTVVGAYGLDFNAGAGATYDLDATRNYWGTSTGPSGFEDAGTCPEASGSTCTGAGGGGTGLGVTNNAPASADCGPPPAAPPQRVTTCPFRTVANFSAGA